MHIKQQLLQLLIGRANRHAFINMPLIPTDGTLSNSWRWET